MKNVTNESFNDLVKDHNQLKEYAEKLYKENEYLKKEYSHLKELYDGSYNSFQRLFKRIIRIKRMIKRMLEKEFNYFGREYLIDFVDILNGKKD